MFEDEVLKWKFKYGSPFDCAQGRREALSRIYEKYVNNLLSIAMGLLNDPYEAEDVVQDVFVSFARKGASLSLKGSLKAYLAQSIVNRVRDMARSERSRHRLMDKQAVIPKDPSEPDQSLVYSERCEQLSSALAELPYEQREVIVLKVKQDMTLKEIAKLQDVSVSTVHGRYRYGLEKLRALLDGEI